MAKLDSAMISIIEEFQNEASEHIQVVTKDLIALEKTDDEVEKVSLIESSLRTAHSIKGASRMLGLKDLEKLIHLFESACLAIKNGKLEADSSIINLFLKTLDLIRPMTENILNPEEAIELDLSSILDSFKSVIPVEDDKKDDVVEVGDNIVNDEKSKEPQEELIKESIDEKQTNEINSIRNEKKFSNTSKSNNSVSKKNDNQNPVTKKSKSSDNTIRVYTSKLDKLMNQVGELLVSKLKSDQLMEKIKILKSELDDMNRDWQQITINSRKLSKDKDIKKISKLLTIINKNMKSMLNHKRNVDNLYKAFYQDNLRASMIINELQDDVRALRMLPASTIFGQYDRIVRDICVETSKKANLVISGKETLVDKSILDGIKDPLMHLIRNAVDHGIELPQERLEKNKPEIATVKLMAMHHGSSLIIKIEDDGKGLNIQKIKSKALENKLITQEEIKNLSDKAVSLLIFRSGLSTAESITNISGRGVGMDVVNDSINRMQGTIDVSTKLNKGSVFTIRLPLSITTMKGILIKLGHEKYILPINSIDRIARLPYSEIVSLASVDSIKIDDMPIALVSLGKVLGREKYSSLTSKPDSITVVILGRDETKIAFWVDDVLSEEEVVLKSLGNQLQKVKNVSGGAILGDGKPVIILSASDLMNSATFSKDQKVFKENLGSDTDAKNILVVDDSITTRAFLQNILLSAGFIVDTVCDGVEAVRKLQNDSYDLIVSDVQMPNMDGLELTKWIKNNQQLKDIPVIMITTLGSDEDKQKGLDAGVDCFITKGETDQKNLIEVVKQFI